MYITSCAPWGRRKKICARGGGGSYEPLKEVGEVLIGTIHSTNIWEFFPHWTEKFSGTNYHQSLRGIKGARAGPRGQFPSALNRDGQCLTCVTPFFGRSN